MMKLGDTVVWAQINVFDIPKKSILIDDTHKEYYIVRYTHRIYNIDKKDIYFNKHDAELIWAICMQESYNHTLEFPDVYLTDDYERANDIATKLLSKYAENQPHLLVKYL
jgi:hypothetical protein